MHQHSELLVAARLAGPQPAALEGERARLLDDHPAPTVDDAQRDLRLLRDRVQQAVGERELRLSGVRGAEPGDGLRGGNAQLRAVDGDQVVVDRPAAQLIGELLVDGAAVGPDGLRGEPCLARHLQREPGIAEGHRDRRRQAVQAER